MTSTLKRSALVLTCLLLCSPIGFAQPLKQPTKLQSAAKANLDWQGSYTGITPCASCAGIKTTLILSAKNRYTLTTQHLAKTDKTKTTNGTFKWHGNTIILQGIQAHKQSTRYKVEENRLKQLDLKGREIKGAYSRQYMLTKNGN